MFAFRLFRLLQVLAMKCLVCVEVAVQCLVWSIAVSLNLVITSSASSKVLYDVLPGELSYYALFIFVGSVFIPAMICLLFTVISIGSFIALGPVNDNCHLVYGNRILDIICIHSDCFRRCACYV